MDHPSEYSANSYSSVFTFDNLPSPVSNKSYSTHSYASVPTDPISHLSLARCGRCKQMFGSNEEFLSTETDNWHKNCFRCAQCFELLPEDLYFSFERRNYCEYDFNKLYAPTCSRCGKFIKGRVIRVSVFAWHPECLLCENCGKQLESDGLWNYGGSFLCSECNSKVKKAGGKVCAECKLYIEPGKSLRYQEEHFHPYHFECTKCKTELEETARLLKNNLYCPKCYDRLCVTCPACKRPIDNERSIFALNKHWHIEHFVCCKCERVLTDGKYHERKDRAYCEPCFVKAFSKVCYKCGNTLQNYISIFKKEWCPACYTCTECNRLLSAKSKVIELDMLPVCKKCYDRFPKELKNRILGR